MYISGIIIFAYTCICTAIFVYKYKNLRVVPIEKNFFGMGDLMFFILYAFEFLQLLSLSPDLIDPESTEMVKKASIYPMMFLNLSDDIIYT